MLIKVNYCRAEDRWDRMDDLSLALHGQLDQVFFLHLHPNVALKQFLQSGWLTVHTWNFFLMVQMIFVVSCS